MWQFIFAAEKVAFTFVLERWMSESGNEKYCTPLNRPWGIHIRSQIFSKYHPYVKKGQNMKFHFFRVWCGIVFFGTWKLHTWGNKLNPMLPSLYFWRFKIRISIIHRWSLQWSACKAGNPSGNSARRVADSIFQGAKNGNNLCGVLVNN